MEAQKPDYSNWSHESLLQRVTELERQLKEQAAGFEASSLSRPRIPPPRPKPSRTNRVFDPAKYSTRLIALKFAYLGQRYNGFEYHVNNKTPLPTVEEALWKVLNKAKLIFPIDNEYLKPGEINWEGCEYSKCGRTDKGVSAFGQVIGIRVRSNRPLEREGNEQSELANCVAQTEKESVHGIDTRPDAVDVASSPLVRSFPTTKSCPSSPLDGPGHESAVPFDSIRDEIPYPQFLNRILPEDIRILAWCPSPPPNFSARFSCKERRYRYFFTQPAFAPTPGPAGLTDVVGDRKPRRREGWLDIQAMRKAAKAFEGLHDFRNFCKVDPGKQITNFERRVFCADIEEVDPRHGLVGYVGRPGFGPFESSSSVLQNAAEDFRGDEVTTPRIYTFTVHGSAFLWHQVRCMAAILFLIGQGLESPSLVSALLDIKANPTRPMYEMATDAPLVLWDCIFPREGSECRDDALDWIYVGDDRMAESGKAIGSTAGDGKFGTGGVVDDMWKVWRKRKIDEVLAGMLLDVAVGPSVEEGSGGVRPRSQRIFDGSNSPAMKGSYVPVLEKMRMESVEVVNARYAAKKGLPAGEDLEAPAFRQVVLNRDDEFNK
ncbi:MAG: hypothetical protein M1835_006498 [Candelina submexicana]|nr:MAG: hypothetical protein M1835_006498 [Candelina submexicana]